MSPSSLLGAAGEHYVMSQLLRRGLISAKVRQPHPNRAAFDATLCWPRLQRALAPIKNRDFAVPLLLRSPVASV